MRVIAITTIAFLSLYLYAASPVLAQEAQTTPIEPLPSTATPAISEPSPAAAAVIDPAPAPTPIMASTRSEWPTLPEFANRKHPPTSVGPEGGGAIPALPLEIKTAGEVTYLTGGIGDEEEAMLKQHYNDFNLHILMSANTGEYISNVLVRIIDDQGRELLSEPDAGPYFYARLKPGTYTVELTATQGGIKKAIIKIPANASIKQHVTFME